MLQRRTRDRYNCYLLHAVSLFVGAFKHVAYYVMSCCIRSSSRLYPRPINLFRAGPSMHHVSKI